MTNALSYLRVSGKGQIEGDGFPRQRIAVAKYAKSRRIEILKEFRDEGVSGTKEAFDREGLTDLLVSVKANGVKTILVERADRLARDLMVSEIILGECRSLGVTVIAVESDTDLTVEDGDPTRVLMRQMLGAISQWEKSVIVQKLRVARMRIKRSSGRCEGRKPFGFRQGEPEVLEKILALSKKGISAALIAQRLNLENVPTRSGERNGQKTQWHTNSVQRIIGRSKKKIRKALSN